MAAFSPTSPEQSPYPASINASELLNAMTPILDATILPINSSASDPILGTPTHFFGGLVAGHNYRITKMMQDNPEVIQKGTNALQCILTMTLFYCQNGILSQTVLPWAGANASAIKQYAAGGAFSKQDDNAYVALAKTRYRIEVGRATLTAYIALGG